MKKLFTFLLVFIGLMAHAQDNKPTKEETIKYINEFLDSQKNQELHYEHDRSYVIRNYTMKNRQARVEIDSAGVHLYSSAQGHTKNIIVDKGTIHESPIEYFIHNARLDRTLYIDVMSGLHGIGLCFIQKEGEKLDRNNFLPLWSFQEGVELNQYKESQIYKAFEHLRKLCGAPEPLKF